MYEICVYDHTNYRLKRKEDWQKHLESKMLMEL